MFNKLAGNLPLADMVAQIIDDSRSKIAAAEGKDEKKDEKKKKLMKYEEKEHGHIPSVKEEEAEKKASAVIDFSDPDEVEKLASALDVVGEQFMKSAADEANHGAEYKGGGELLPDNKMMGGKQSYAKDKSKSHNIPERTAEQSGDGGGPAKTQVENDAKPSKILKYTHAEYPKKGVMKTAEEVATEEKPKSASVLALQAALAKTAEFPPKKEEKKGEEKEEKKEGKAPPFAKKEEKGEEKKDEGEKDKKASPVDYILNKMANVEKRMGGETLDSKSGDGPKPPTGGTNSARSMIASNAAATDAKKVQTKAPQKKLMAEVLTEPMQSKAHDAKVQENLRNASKGGVKIAAARELLKKIAAEGCTCDGKGECKHCKMKAAMEKKSTGMPATGSSMPSSAAPMM